MRRRPPHLLHVNESILVCDGKTCYGAITPGKVGKVRCSGYGIHRHAEARQRELNQRETKMHLGISYKQQPVTGSFDAIVIGSGMGGLSAAVLLARHARKRVLVLERHYTAGGYTQTFTRPGFEWDVGLHYVGATAPGSPFRDVLDHLTDGALEWADMGDIYDRIVFGPDVYDFPKGASQFRDALVERFPAEAKAIDRYLDLVGKAVHASQMFFTEKAVPAAVAALFGGLMRRRAQQFTRRTTLDVLRSLTSNEQLIGVLTAQYEAYGSPPSESSFFMHALVADHFLNGGAYPVGGAKRFVETILPGILAAGGALYTSAEVKEILVERGRAAGVRMADGRELRAPLVVSDAGARTTFGHLLGSPDASRFRTLLDRIPSSSAHAVLYVGLNKTASELRLPKTNFTFYPGYDHDRSVAAYSRDPAAPLPLVHISFPSAKDPDFEHRFPGRATIEVTTWLPYRGFEKWEQTKWHDRGPEYDAAKAALHERLLAALREQFPQVEGAIAAAELSTPLSTRHFLGHEHGESSGLAHTPERFAARWLRPRTGIPGLFLTGVDVCCCGIYGASMAGVLAASAILGKNLLSVIESKKKAAPRSQR